MTMSKNSNTSNLVPHLRAASLTPISHGDNNHSSSQALDEDHVTQFERTEDEESAVGDEVLDMQELASPALVLEPASPQVLDLAESKVSYNEVAPSESNAKTPKRRKPIGNLHRFCLIKELEDPFEYSRGVKYLLLLIFAFAGMVPAMGSAIFFPAVNDISAEFDTTLTVINVWIF